jgi:serine/threonine protein kinase
MHREGNILKKLYHPHIIQLLEIIETESVLCLVLELVDVDVLTYICSSGKQSEDQASDYRPDISPIILLAIALGLGESAAHECMYYGRW